MSTEPERAADQVHLVVLGIDRHRLGVPLEYAERLEQTVAFTPLPGAPQVVAGIIDVAGEVVVVFDTRRRLGLPQRQQRGEDLLLLARTGMRRVALTADSVFELTSCDSVNLREASAGLPAAPYLRGVVSLADGLVVVTDLERFLDAAEEEALSAALDMALSDAEPAM